jgi:glycosyltransferase involved in cell wall biosynthesis
VVVIGEGPARPWFEKALPDGIFVGHQEGDNLARALASADLFLNPSITETFGNVTLEAMACALPVVAVSATGATSLVRDGETGILAEPGDICALADAIAAYAASASLRRRHGEAGLAFAKTQDWDVINGAVLRTYARAIERRERLQRMKG